MKRFVLHPGPVVSKHDWERHWVGASALMDLYRVAPQECIIVDEWDPRTFVGRRDLSRYLHLYPMTGPDYRPVSDRERELYPLSNS